MTETHFERSKLNQEPSSSSAADPPELHEAWGTNYKLDVPEGDAAVVFKIINFLNFPRSFYRKQKRTLDFKQEHK
ncbi:hypothetical protein C5167_005674 [Papaver somniferum]|uniref:Uncharacterized protein n=1 Tax=Papaver somniferum TaxID=3469 RepID=A0A4Y7JC40_PAPSO|nr:hypothetical protein C5167_005674 [Papaver somniferum]